MTIVTDDFDVTLNLFQLDKVHADLKEISKIRNIKFKAFLLECELVKTCEWLSIAFLFDTVKAASDCLAEEYEKIYNKAIDLFRPYNLLIKSKVFDLISDVYISVYYFKYISRSNFLERVSKSLYELSVYKKQLITNPLFLRYPKGINIYSRSSIPLGRVLSNFYTTQESFLCITAFIKSSTFVPNTLLSEVEKETIFKYAGEHRYCFSLEQVWFILKSLIILSKDFSKLSDFSDFMVNSSSASKSLHIVEFASEVKKEFYSSYYLGKMLSKSENEEIITSEIFQQMFKKAIVSRLESFSQSLHNDFVFESDFFVHRYGDDIEKSIAVMNNFIFQILFYHDYQLKQRIKKLERMVREKA